MKLNQLFEAKKQTLYLSRKLVNGDDVVAWAKKQGFTNCTAPDDMHVTIAYSKKKIDMTDMTDSFDDVYSRHDGKMDDTMRAMDAFGPKKDAIVLKFECEDLTRRWKEIIDDFGASWDHDGYRPHVTITYDGLPEGLELEDIEPYEGELHFGPEEFSEVKKNWAKSIEEVDLEKIKEAAEKANLSLQPDGKWKKDADCRSAQRTASEVKEMGGVIEEAADTDSKAFKLWFKNSKVVDAAGKPMVVYHGTSSNFRSFNMKKQVMGVIWFTTNKNEIDAGEVGAAGKGRVLDLYASIQNPAGWEEYDKFGIGELISRGYDGAILPTRGGFHGIVFQPTQLKSASKNNGNFDAHNKNLFETCRDYWRDA